MECNGSNRDRPIHNKILQSVLCNQSVGKGKQHRDYVIGFQRSRWGYD